MTVLRATWAMIGVGAALGCQAANAPSAVAPPAASSSDAAVESAPSAASAASAASASAAPVASASAAPAASSNQSQAPVGPKTAGRISWDYGPTDAPTRTLVVFDHAAACNESMPSGTKTIFEADVGSALAGKATRLVRGVSWCAPDGTCAPVSDATLTYTLDGSEWVGEITFTSKGQTKKVSFRALSCPVPDSERMVCG